MSVDTKGLRREHVGKRLRLELSSGEVGEVKLLDVTVCDPPEPCCGITYTVLSTNQSDQSKTPGSTHWTAFREINSFGVLGD
jgi:hypothetical protein